MVLLAIGEWALRSENGTLGSRGAVLRRNNAPRHEIPFLCYTEKRGYIVCVVEIAGQYVDVSFSNFPAANLDFVAFRKPFDRLQVCRNFDYWVKDTIFDRRLKLVAIVVVLSTVVVLMTTLFLL